MEKSRLEPETTMCKIDVLPIKLNPLWISKEWLEHSRDLPQKNLSFHCLPIPALRFREKVTRTLTRTIMSSTLYRLSYIPSYMRVKDSHQYFPVMSQTCYYYNINPQYFTLSRLDRVRTCDTNIERVMSYHLTTNPLVFFQQKAQYKYRTCFNWLQNNYITFMLTKHN